MGLTSLMGLMGWLLASFLEAAVVPDLGDKETLLCLCGEIDFILVGALSSWGSLAHGADWARWAHRAH